MEFKKREPIVFVLSGKANSGKDTTAEFIDNYVKLKGYKVINLQFSSYIKMYAKKISGWNGDEESKPRTLLQQLGTDIIRNKIDNYLFINRIIEDIKVYSYYFDVITISDARLPEELDSIKNEFKNVYRVRVERPDYKSSLNEEELKHKTETALNSYKNYEYKVINNGTLEELNEKVINIVNEVI